MGREREIKDPIQRRERERKRINSAPVGGRDGYNGEKKIESDE